MAKENYIKICPKCGSTNIMEGVSVWGNDASSLDCCEDCKYQGIIPQIEESEVEGFRKELKEQ